MRAGRLRHRVEIQHPLEPQDATGDVVKSWEKLDIVWAGRRDLSGRELFRAQQNDAEVTTEWIIRYRADVDARMRIIDGSVCYGIRSVQDPDGRGERLILLCARTVNE